MRHALTRLTILCLAGLCLSISIAAEDEVTLLTITGDLIDRIPTLDHGEDPRVIIDSYYALLSPAARSEIESLHRELADLMPDYDVAYAAADTAELNNVVDDFDHCWAEIRTIHAREFTPEVVVILQAAYAAAYPLTSTPQPDAGN